VFWCLGGVIILPPNHKNSKLHKSFLILNFSKAKKLKGIKGFFVFSQPEKSEKYF